MSICTDHHKSRLFIGEANFKGVAALLNKHAATHPSLGKSITATELSILDRTSDKCLSCEEEKSIAQMAALLKESQDTSSIFCSEKCKRIQSLKDKGVTVILGYDGTKMHEHLLTAEKHFQRIHWNCPHDKSSYTSQTLPPIIKDFFASATKLQKKGDRVHVTLAQPIQPHDKTKFYQAVVYNIREAAKTSGYMLYAKRPFGPDRYPGYQHEQTGNDQPAPGAERQREFVFIKGKMPEERAKSTIGKQTFGTLNNAEREYYLRATDDESSDYDTDGDDDVGNL